MARRYSRLIFNAFVHFTPSVQGHGHWRYPKTNWTARHYNSLDHWVNLARDLERGRFDAMFFGDVLGAYDVYQGSPDAAIKQGAYFPTNDASVIVSALAHATEHLGFIVTSSILQAHPFEFARRMSTLDHMTNGRVGWNIVTSYLDSAARNLGLDALPEHSMRYEMAEEYLDVVYKLWEASWEDEAAVYDTERGVMFDPARIHPIDHRGAHYRSAGPHIVQPSPQRTPLLVQAGGSDRGKRFAATHAEVTFIPGAGDLQAYALQVEGLDAKLAEVANPPRDVRPLSLFSPVIGSTEEEARRKQRELREWVDVDATLAEASVMGYDFSRVPREWSVAQVLDDPAGAGLDVASYGVQMQLGILANFPDKDRSYLEFVSERANLEAAFAGTPEQIADRIEEFADAGVGGINILPVATEGWMEDWVSQVVPVLQDRGLLQREYAPGTLREKLFRRGPYLPASHPARKTTISASIA